VRGVLKLRSERIGNDAYLTPPALALAICARLRDLGIHHPGRVLEPGAGAGAFMRATAETWPDASVTGYDLEPKLPGIIRADFLKGTQGHAFALILGNPPYLFAEDFVHVGLDRATHFGFVAFLLRLSFLGGQGRADSLWNARNLRWLAPITPRPSFTPDGKTDAAEYALFVWQRGYVGNAELLAPLRWSRSTSKQLPLRGPDSDEAA
jgi:hypothetical protein